MAEEVEVDPGVGAAAFGAAEHAAVEAPGFFEIADVKSKVKDGHVTFCVESYIFHNTGLMARGLIIRPMPALRRAHRLASFVLIWFVLSLGVAVASPVVHPQAMELVCSAAGASR